MTTSFSPGVLVGMGRTRAQPGSIKAAKAPHDDTYEVDTAQPKFGEQAGIKQTGSLYNLRRDHGTPTPPRWTGIPAGLGETPPADSRRRKALPRVNLKRDHETLNLPPNSSENLPPFFRSSNPVTERPQNGRPRFEPPTPSGEIFNAAAQTAENNKQLEQQRKHRKDYLNDVWTRPHEPPVQPNRPGTAEGTASPSSHMMTPVGMKTPAIIQPQQAMAFQPQGASSQIPMANLTQARAQTLQAMTNGQMRGIMPPGGQQIDRPKTTGPATPAQMKAMRNFGSQQTTTAHAPSESARTQPVDKFDHRSPAIANEWTFCSGHRFTRGELKYTISEDRTTDAFKRRKVHFIALGQPSIRAATVEAPRMREARMAALEQSGKLRRVYDDDSEEEEEDESDGGRTTVGWEPLPNSRPD
ncbi:uncharacterized protein J4E79_006695 [Alternaria viburni]|nr:uncharacterized protein J4E79_006695 [Alternaria viburni]KAI4658935.1 hypothetical protein J4E79_006695 [Alternaria viburni]